MLDLHMDALIELGIFIVGWIFGFAHLKFESNQTKKELEEHKKEVKADILSINSKHESLAGDIWKELTLQGKTLARIEGKLDTKS